VKRAIRFFPSPNINFVLKNCPHPSIDFEKYLFLYLNYEKSGENPTPQV
jgi:hypothetical protein